MRKCLTPLLLHSLTGIAVDYIVTAADTVAVVEAVVVETVAVAVVETVAVQAAVVDTVAVVAVVVAVEEAAVVDFAALVAVLVAVVVEYAVVDTAVVNTDADEMMFVELDTVTSDFLQHLMKMCFDSYNNETLFY